MNHPISRTLLPAILACLIAADALAATGVKSDPLAALRQTIDSIGALEDRRDPKCHATASRLEDFMYGTPLTDAARFRQHALQKALVLKAWRAADKIAREHQQSEVDRKALNQALDSIFGVALRANGDVATQTQDRQVFEITQRDLRQYGSVAYALRALLGVQHDQWLSGRQKLLSLSDDAIPTLKNAVELASLTALQSADIAARLNNQYRVDETLLNTAWQQGFGLTDNDEPKAAETSTDIISEYPYALTRQVILQKLASYSAYNKVSTAVFVRNIQVYFARHRWPSNPEESRPLKIYFNEGMIRFAKDLLQGAQRLASQAGQLSVRAAHVDTFADTLAPHRINEYEDAIFFPRLPTAEQVVLEAYDMDAFRDGGLHWQYLQSAVDDLAADAGLEPDPFALELLAENIAQFGVLVLRLAGEAAQRGGKRDLSIADFDSAIQTIQARLQRHAALPGDNGPKAAQALASSTAPAPAVASDEYFTDVTASSQIRFEHRLSDWLSRTIRSYSVLNKEVAVLGVPPAFGGSGVAAEDLDGDGRPEVLLTGGRGNRLFRNLGAGRFEDVTPLAGIAWQRAEDGLPGEPRQPILADFDNDGKADIFISYANDDHRLYRNLGGLRFDDITARAGLGGKGLIGGPATAFDYDNDGLLDLYISYFGQYTEGTVPTLARRNTNGLPNKLFRNVGSMQFTDVTIGSGLDNTGWTQALSHTDLDRDGKQDLIVGNDFGVNAYYRNQGDGTFEDISKRIGTGKPSFTMSVGLADLNDDLYPDVYISNIVTMDKDQKYVTPSAETAQKFDASTLANMRVVEANDLFLSQASTKSAPDYTLSEAVGRGYSSTGWAWGADFFDFDNDGDDDLYVANGMNDFAVYSTENPYYADPDGNERNIEFAASQADSNVFFENRDGKLVNISRKSGADLLGNSRAVVYLDMDDDGDLDMIVNNFNGPAVVYRNNAQNRSANWMKIRLTGAPDKNTTRDAIGARIVVSTEDGRRRWREIHGSVGYLTMHPKQQHFGLGESNKANIRVEWPNGSVSEFTEVTAGRSYVIDMASGKITAKQSTLTDNRPQTDTRNSQS